MQANEISLAVDVLNTGSTTAEVYTRYQEFQDRSVYVGADHLPENRNMIGLYRTFPTKTGNFKGVAKTSVKFTKDVVVPGVDGVAQLTAPIIFDLSVSIPVGTAAADILHMRQRLLALIDMDSIMDALQRQLSV